MPGHGIILYEDIPTSGLPINIPNGVCGLDGAAQVAAAQLGLAVLDTDVGVAGGVASLDGGGCVPAAQLCNGVLASAVGAPGGVASLDGGGQVPASQLGNATGVTLLELISVGGVFATASAVFVPIPGTSLPFVLASPETVRCEGFATAISDAIFGVPNASFGLRIDGTDYPGTYCASLAAATFDYGSLAASKVLALLAGPHTVELVVRIVFGGWAVATIDNTAFAPSVVNVSY